VSALARFLRNGGLPSGFWIAGDDAYECTESIITPIPRRRAPLGSREDAFNYYQSSLLMHVQQVFGVLVARWGVMWTPLKFDFHRAIRVVYVALNLHNHCIDEKEPYITASMTEAEQRANVESFAGWMAKASSRVGNNSVRRTDLQGSITRDALVAEIGDNRRPPGNSALLKVNTTGGVTAAASLSANGSITVVGY